MFISCAKCHMAKSHFHQGLYTRLLVPSRPWDDISVDFILSLPRTPRGKDAIMVVVDWFSKMAHFIACHKCSDTTYIADLFFQEIMRLCGVPRTIILDRDTKFLSYFCRCLQRLMGTKLLFSTISHPQIDGKMKVTNQTLTILLRDMVSKSLSDWDVKLPHAEFAYIRSPSYATSHSSFEVCYGLNPLNPLDLIPILKNRKWALKLRKGLKRWKSYMSKWGLKLRRWMSNTRPNQQELHSSWVPTRRSCMVTLEKGKVTLKKKEQPHG